MRGGWKDRIRYKKRNRVRPKVFQVNKKRFSDLNLAPVDRMYLCEWAGFPYQKASSLFYSEENRRGAQVCGRS